MTSDISARLPLIFSPQASFMDVTKTAFNYESKAKLDIISRAKGNMCKTGENLLCLFENILNFQQNIYSNSYNIQHKFVFSLKSC